MPSLTQIYACKLVHTVRTYAQEVFDALASSDVAVPPSLTQIHACHLWHRYMHAIFGTNTRMQARTHCTYIRTTYAQEVHDALASIEGEAERLLAPERGLLDAGITKALGVRKI